MSTLNPDLSHLSMADLFRIEVETQSAVLTKSLLGLEQAEEGPKQLGVLMRAAHSLKGASRIVGRRSAVRIAHAMEDCFVAAQKDHQILSAGLIDALLGGVDFINRIAQIPDEAMDHWEKEQQQQIEGFVTSLAALAEAASAPPAAAVNVAERSTETPLVSTPAAAAVPDAAERPKLIPSPDASTEASGQRVLRVNAEYLSGLMALAGEALVASRWLDSYAADLLRLKQRHHQISRSLDELRDALPESSAGERSTGLLNELREKFNGYQLSFTERISELDVFDHRFISFSSRLYDKVLDCRMRPFADELQGFPRMIREVARSLGKSVKFVVTGESTAVDRDILERLKAPLDHLLRNSLDHGIETPEERIRVGKPAEGTIQLQACHRAGMLLVTVADDGRGVDIEAVRSKLVQRKLAAAETAQRLTKAEVLEFLFLPGFTLKESVSEISGRGVGLEVVQAMARQVGGRVSISSEPGTGTRFQLELPLTLSVVRTLLVDIGGEPVLPLARVERALKLPRERISSLQGRQHFSLGEEQIGLVTAHQILELEKSPQTDGDISIVVLGEKAAQYGVVIDRFLGERELVVRALDPRLGKIRNISSAALMPDGSPVLIIDVDDLKRSIENLASGERLAAVNPDAPADSPKKRRRVLIVDDSLTVRELERKLLDGRGYVVDVAVDGMDGWNAVRTGHYDLIVTDVDMPRLDGIELVKLIRKDHRLKTLPVMIVSYKDRPEDRSRGLEAGADYYLTKASFQDETLVSVVADLIGGAEA